LALFHIVLCYLYFFDGNISYSCAVAPSDCDFGMAFFSDILQTWIGIGVVGGIWDDDWDAARSTACRVWQALMGNLYWMSSNNIRVMVAFWMVCSY
jgi:hypothetical protein